MNIKKSGGGGNNLSDENRRIEGDTRGVVIPNDDRVCIHYLSNIIISSTVYQITWNYLQISTGECWSTDQNRQTLLPYRLIQLFRFLKFVSKIPSSLVLVFTGGRERSGFVDNLERSRFNNRKNYFHLLECRRKGD